MDVCHLSAPCETPSSSNTVFGFVLEREACVVVLGIFTAPPAPRQLVFASQDFLQQKGNRCALMSTADYSRNIARKMRPRSSDGLSVKTTLVSVLPHELGGFLFGGGGGEPTGWQLPVQHRRQRQNPTCPHPLLVHVTAALLSPNIERVPPTPYRF